VLNGIGGRTVEEAQERMSYAEFLDWLTFIKMRGSLNLGNRLESGFALLLSSWIKSKGGTAEQIDFMPHADRDAADINSVMGMLAGRNRG
jgi:hypothetical protein